MILATGADPDSTGPAQAQKWAFQNGDKAGGSGALVNTNVTLTQNSVYEFVISVDPANKSWSAKVTNVGTSDSFTSQQCQ